MPSQIKKTVFAVLIRHFNLMCQKLCIYYGIIINLLKIQGNKFDVFIEYPKDQ